MKSFTVNYLAASIALLASGAATRVEAGRPLPSSPPVYGPLDGSITLGIGFTAKQIEGSANLLAPLYRAPDGNNMFFLDGNWNGQGMGNENASAGLGFRHRFVDPDIIFGVNAFYDYGDYSGRGYNQTGVGLELLSKWVDFRVNGYFPTNSVQPFERRSSTDVSTKTTASVATRSTSNTQFIDGGEGGIDLNETTTKTTTTITTHRKTTRVRRVYERQESSMPGFDAELGGLIPYLECWSEVRVYAGYAYFDDRFGNDISCFTARLEARPVPAVIFDAQYKGDARLLDGESHWYFGTRVEIPFDLGNLAHGQSPFAGITQAFTPQGPCWQSDPSSDGKQLDKKMVVPAEEMRNRMNEGIIRNWRPTVSRSGFEEISKDTDAHSSTTISSKTTTTVTDTPIAPAG